MTIKKKKVTILLFILIAISLIAKGQNNQPNILLLISDQHGGKIMTQTGYQYIKTPGLDKLRTTDP